MSTVEKFIEFVFVDGKLTASDQWDPKPEHSQLSLEQLLMVDYEKYAPNNRQMIVGEFWVALLCYDGLKQVVNVTYDFEQYKAKQDRITWISASLKFMSIEFHAYSLEREQLQNSLVKGTSRGFGNLEVTLPVHFNFF